MVTVSAGGVALFSAELFSPGIEGSTSILRVEEEVEPFVVAGSVQAVAVFDSITVDEAEAAGSAVSGTEDGSDLTGSPSAGVEDVVARVGTVEAVVVVADEVDDTVVVEEVGCALVAAAAPSGLDMLTEPL